MCIRDRHNSGTGAEQGSLVLAMFMGTTPGISAVAKLLVLTELICVQSHSSLDLMNARTALLCFMLSIILYFFE